MIRLALLILILFAAAADAGGRKPVLTIYGSNAFRNCMAFSAAWNEKPEFRAAIEAKYDVRFAKTLPPGTCVPMFVVEGSQPLCGFRGVDVLLWELGIAPPASPPPNATTAAELNAIRDAINSAARTSQDARDIVTALDDRHNKTIEQLGELKKTSESRWDRLKELDEFRDVFELQAQANAARDRRLEAIEKKPTPPAKPTPPEPAKVADVAVRLFGFSLTIAQLFGVVATGSTGVGALAVLVPLAIRGIARRRAARRSGADRPPDVSVEPQPPATRVIPETRFTPIVTDRFAEAYAWTRAEYGRRYPGSADVLDTFDGMLRQHVDSRSPRS